MVPAKLRIPSSVQEQTMHDLAELGFEHRASLARQELYNLSHASKSSTHNLFWTTEALFFLRNTMEISKES